MTLISDGYNNRIREVIVDWTDPASLFALHFRGIDKIYSNRTKHQLISWPSLKRYDYETGMVNLSLDALFLRTYIATF